MPRTLTDETARALFAPHLDQNDGELQWVYGIDTPGQVGDEGGRGAIGRQQNRWQVVGPFVTKYGKGAMICNPRNLLASAWPARAGPRCGPSPNWPAGP